MTNEQLLREIENSGSPKKVFQVKLVRELLARYSDIIPLSEKQQNELQRRLIDYRNRPAQQQAWAEVKARIRSGS